MLHVTVTRVVMPGGTYNINLIFTIKVIRNSQRQIQRKNHLFTKKKTLKELYSVFFFTALVIMDFSKAFVKCNNFKYRCHIKCNLPSVITSRRGKNLCKCLPTPNSFRSNHQCNLLVVRSRLKSWFINKVSFFDEIILRAVKPIYSVSRYIGS